MDFSLGMLVRGIAAASLACAVSLTAAQPGQAQDKKPLIGVSMSRQEEQRWVFDRAAMEAEAAKLGADIVFLYANNDQTKQAAQVESLIAQQPDVIMLNPVDREAAGSIVNAVRDAGIPIIDYEGGITTAKPDYYVTRDNYEAGTLQMTEAAKFAPKGNYAFVNGNPTWGGWKPTVNAYKDKLATMKDVKVVFDQNGDWDPAKAQTKAENALSANSDKIDAFIVMNDGMATGVVAALRARDLLGKVYVSGVDGETSALNRIAKGEQTMTIYTDLVEEGSSAVRAAVAFAKGEKPVVDKMVDNGAGEVPTRVVPLIAVTKANLCDAIKVMPQGWTTVEAVFEDANACK